MLLIISPEELEPEFKDSWKLGHLSNLCIDYATNAIHATYLDREVIIFKFKDYGWVHDNRFNNYELAIGRAGILITVNKT